jgi:hypothetical protein
MSICYSGAAAGIAAIDISTGEVSCTYVSGEDFLALVKNEIGAYAPSEIIFNRPAAEVADIAAFASERFGTLITDKMQRIFAYERAKALATSAFGDDVAYCFYVPTSWNIRMDDSIYSAHVEIKDEATGAYDRTSVSVIPHLPQNASGQMSVAEYFEWNRSEMEKIGGADGFEMISTTEGMNLGNRQATLYEYRFRVGGEWYHYRQYVVAYRSMIYCLTYTSTDAYYDAHLAELEAIVGAFQFR